MIFDSIDDFLSQFPRKQRDADIDLYTHAISGTPFVVIYDFDDTELRIFFIVHSRAERIGINADDAEW